MYKYSLLILIIYSIAIVNCQKFKELFKWKQIEFEQSNSNSDTNIPPTLIFPGRTNRDVSSGRNYPSNAVAGVNKNSKSNNFDYIAYNNIPLGATHYKGRLFICVPRRNPGVPSTLNYIQVSPLPQTSSPKLRPYPDFSINQLQTHVDENQNDKNIVSVYRTRADACDRLWFVDTGILEYPGNTNQIQQPSIWIMDLKTDKRLRRFEIPRSTVTDGRGLASITVDVDSNNCNDAYAYLPDLFNHALHVYSFQQNRIWTFHHNYFSFDPLQGDLNIGGQQFQWDDGIFSLTLGNKNSNGYRTAYFHAMASTSEFSVSTKVLRNENNANRSYHGNDFKLLGNRGDKKQSNMHDFDPKSGVILYAEIQQSGVGCWNTNKPFSTENFETIQKSDKTMIYPCDLQVDSEGVAWVLTNSMPLFIYSTLNPNEYNFRIWTQSVSNAIEGTRCNSSPTFGGDNNNLENNNHKIFFPNN